MFAMPSSGTYSRLSDIDDAETLLSAKPDLQNSTRRNHILPSYFISISLLVASITVATLGFLVGRHFPTNLDATCTRHTSKYSPILDENIISYDWVQFDGRFAHENAYRQGPGPEVDTEWEALGVDYRPFLLPDTLASKAGLTRNHTHRNPDLGGGYPVFVEGMHHLHCLNVVRKSLYYNYDYYLNQGKGAFGDSPQTLRWHVSHCVDILRQRLMCTVDTGAFGAVWVNRTNPQPFVDFNTRHVCKNFDAIRAWAERNQIPKNLPADFWEMPGDDVYIWEEAP